MSSPDPVTITGPSTPAASNEPSRAVATEGPILASAYARRILNTYPQTVDIEFDTRATAIEALHDCAQACTADADADLGVPNLTEMVRCIRLCLHCADICTATAAVISRSAECEADITKPLLEACLAACKTCGEECEGHAHMHEHCRICAEACRRCEDACRQVLAALK